MFIGHLYIFFGKMFRSAHFLIGLFVFLMLSCVSCLYILEINPLSVISFAIFFSHSESCLLILFTVSFAVQRLLSLIRPHLFIFVFISITLVKCKRKKQKQKILSLKAIFSWQRVKMML